MNNINPYKLLEAIDQQDRLVGRDNDVKNFMEILNTKNTKIVILHGYSGAGKSSFLSAGLLPMLDLENNELKKFDIPSRYEKRVVSCGMNPFKDLSNFIYNSQWKEDVFKIKEDIGGEIEEIDNNIINKFHSERYLDDFLKKKEGIGSFFVFFSFHTPYTKILIIDHVEKIFTSSYEDSFINGIRYFSEENCDAKIILSIRTEFSGRLISKIMDDNLFSNRIKSVYLNDIENKEYLIKIVKDPCEFADNRIPSYIVELILKKKRKDVSVLPILHIICYGIFERMLKRTINAEKNKKITWDDVTGEIKNIGVLNEDSGDDIFIQIMSSFVNGVIEDACKDTVFAYKEEEIYNLLNELIDKAGSRGYISKMVKEYLIKDKIDKINEKKSGNNEGIIAYLDQKRIIAYNSPYLELSHDLIAEAVVFLVEKPDQRKETGLEDVFENKRDPRVEKTMAIILDEFKRNPSGTLRIASMIGKQFFHENRKKDVNLYELMNDLLESIQKMSLIKPANIRVIVARPYSQLFLYRAERELRDEMGMPFKSDEYVNDTFHNDTLIWKENRIFIDSTITIGRLLFLIEKYKGIIDVRLSNFMPISLVSSANRAIFNPYTFSADGKINENEEWCGALPIYHHKDKKSYQYELERHFDYLWQKGITINCFKDITIENIYRKHKSEFIQRVLDEKKRCEVVP